jgi:hypothetical protein
MSFQEDLLSAIMERHIEGNGERKVKKVGSWKEALEKEGIFKEE